MVNRQYFLRRLEAHLRSLDRNNNHHHRRGRRNIGKHHCHIHLVTFVGSSRTTFEAARLTRKLIQGRLMVGHDALNVAMVVRSHPLEFYLRPHETNKASITRLSLLTKSSSLLASSRNALPLGGKPNVSADGPM